MAGKRSSSGMVEDGVYNNGKVCLIFLSPSVPYKRRSLPPVFLNVARYVMRIRLTVFPIIGSTGPRSIM